MCSPRQLPVCYLKGEEGDEKEMGDLGSGEVEQLDRNMWAPDENEDKQKASFLLSLNYLQIGETFYTSVAYQELQDGPDQLF